MPPPWTVEEANASLPRLAETLERLRAGAAGARERARTIGDRAPGNGHARWDPGGAELQTVIDELAAEGVVLRDVMRGLVDLEAATSEGRRYWLCWVLGEPEVAFWHWPEDGFAGRKPVSELPD